MWPLKKNVTFFKKRCPIVLVVSKKRLPLHSQSGKMMNGCRNDAEIAQLVEHNLAKVRVASSSLVFRSEEKTAPVVFSFFMCFSCVDFF